VCPNFSQPLSNCSGESLGSFPVVQGTYTQKLLFHPSSRRTTCALSLMVCPSSLSTGRAVFVPLLSLPPPEGNVFPFFTLFPEGREKSSFAFSFPSNRTGSGAPKFGPVRNPTRRTCRSGESFLEPPHSFGHLDLGIGSGFSLSPNTADH